MFPADRMLMRCDPAFDCCSFRWMRRPRERAATFAECSLLPYKSRGISTRSRMACKREPMTATNLDRDNDANNKHDDNISVIF